MCCEFFRTHQCNVLTAMVCQWFASGLPVVCQWFASGFQWFPAFAAPWKPRPGTGSASGGVEACLEISLVLLLCAAAKDTFQRQKRLANSPHLKHVVDVICHQPISKRKPTPEPS